MILYNVTIKVEQDIAADWLRWMKEVHIPDVLATGFFSSSKLLQIREDEPDDGGVTYAVQYVCPTQDKFDEYVEHYARDLQQQHAERYKNRYVAIRTIMDILEETNLFASKS